MRLECCRAVLRIVAVAGVVCALAVPSAAASKHRPARLTLRATAYCQSGTTKSGVHTRPGIVAADPRILPMGTVLRIDTPRRYAGVYTVADTGAGVKGRELDIYMKSCARARTFGRQTVHA